MMECVCVEGKPGGYTFGRKSRSRGMEVGNHGLYGCVGTGIWQKGRGNKHSSTPIYRELFQKG